MGNSSRSGAGCGGPVTVLASFLSKDLTSRDKKRTRQRGEFSLSRRGEFSPSRPGHLTASGPALATSSSTRSSLGAPFLFCPSFRRDTHSSIPWIRCQECRRSGSIPEDDRGWLGSVPRGFHATPQRTATTLRSSSPVIRSHPAPDAFGFRSEPDPAGVAYKKKNAPSG